MTRSALLKAVAIWLGVLIGLAVIADAQEPGFILTGKLTYADHELEDGTFWVGKIAVVAPKGSRALLGLDALRGRDVELVLRPVEPRQPEGISR